MAKNNVNVVETVSMQTGAVSVRLSWEVNDGKAKCSVKGLPRRSMGLDEIFEFVRTTAKSVTITYPVREERGISMTDSETFVGAAFRAAVEKDVPAARAAA